MMSRTLATIVVLVALTSTVDAKLMSTSRACLHHDTRDLLNRLEARWGKVTLVSTCRPGARMPSGQQSMHAVNRAFDFLPPRGKNKGEIMVWLTHNASGVVMSYRRMHHVHADTGPFRKTIYAARDHVAGDRAVAIWQEREKTAAFLAALAPAAPIPLPRPVRDIAPDVLPFEVVEEVEYAAPPNIFQRFFTSRDVIVNPWVKTTCSDGKPLPDALQRLLVDASRHFRCPVYVNSAYRNPAYNRRVGGARYSQHVQCRAVDFRVGCAATPETKKWVYTNRAAYRVTGIGTYRTHVHADIGERVKLVQWHGNKKRYAKRRHQRYASG